MLRTGFIIYSCISIKSPLLQLVFLLFYITKAPISIELNSVLLLACKYKIYSMISTPKTITVFRNDYIFIVHLEMVTVQEKVIKQIILNITKHFQSVSNPVF